MPTSYTSTHRTKKTLTQICRHPESNVEHAVSSFEVAFLQHRSGLFMEARTPAGESSHLVTWGERYMVNRTYPNGENSSLNG